MSETKCVMCNGNNCIGQNPTRAIFYFVCFFLAFRPVLEPLSCGIHHLISIRYVGLFVQDLSRVHLNQRLRTFRKSFGINFGAHKTTVPRKRHAHSCSRKRIGHQVHYQLNGIGRLFNEVWHTTDVFLSRRNQPTSFCRFPPFTAKNTFSKQLSQGMPSISFIRHRCLVGIFPYPS